MASYPYNLPDGHNAKKCTRCTKNIHCEGDHRCVFRPGEKSRTIRCQCECNEYGQVQLRKGHTVLTREMVLGARKSFNAYWKARGINRGRA